MRSGRCPALGVFAIQVSLLGLGSVTFSIAAETGNVCVRDGSPGQECNGNDVSVSGIAPLILMEDCASGDPETAEAVLEMRISAGVETRYDIGLFVSLNGDSALSGGGCLHDYLEPPLTTEPAYGDSDGNGRSDLDGGPWWNGEPFVPADKCGDMEANTDAIKTLITLRFACVDTTSDGIVDVSTCTSWRPEFP